MDRDETEMNQFHENGDECVPFLPTTTWLHGNGDEPRGTKMNRDETDEPVS